MKFTIDSFKLDSYKPAEKMMCNDSIQHLVLDLNKQYGDMLRFEYGVNSAGNIFYIEVFKRLDADSMSCKDHGTCLSVEFVGEDKILFKENFEELIKTPLGTSNDYYLPYWMCVSIQKKLVSTAFKALISMQDYSDIDKEINSR